MSIYYIGSISCSGQSLYHHGVKGMKWGKHLFGLWDKYVTGSTAKRMRDTYQTRMHYNLGGVERATQTGNSNMMKLNQQSMQRNAELFNRYNESYNNSLAGRINRSPAMSRALSKASRLATTAYTSAASALGGAGRSISQFYNDVMAKAKDAINAGAQLVSKYGQAFVDNIKQMGKNVIDGARAFIDKILDRRQKAQMAPSKEEEDAATKRDYSVKLMNRNSAGDIEDESADKKKKSKTNSKKEKEHGSSKSVGNSSRLSDREREKERKKKETKKLKKVYRSAGKMDLSPDGTPGLSKYLSNLQNLRR